MNFDNLKRLEQGFKVSFPTDEKGLTGRECPNPECLGYFKVKFGTGLKGKNLPCHCPYCGHVAAHDHFWTKEQIGYARSIIENEVSKALKADTQQWDRNLRQSTRNSFIKLSVDFKSNSRPIQYYREKNLETTVICENCTLEYAVYGPYAFCPDCGVHNSLQILTSNFVLAEKEVEIAKTISVEGLGKQLIEDAFENLISSFDAFGKTICRAYASKSTNTSQAETISFQNIKSARDWFLKLFGFDFASRISVDEWEFVYLCFQKRHLLAHCNGIVDSEYILKTKDNTYKMGQRINIPEGLIYDLVPLLISMSAEMSSFLRTK
jgi:rubrerythrin